MKPRCSILRAFKKNTPDLNKTHIDETEVYYAVEKKVLLNASSSFFGRRRQPNYGAVRNDLN